MSRDGAGTYSLPATMATASAVASSVTVNSIMNDVAQALTDSINKDGTKAFAAAQSMGNNRLTSLAAGTALTDAAQLSQVQKGNVSRAITVGGTVDAITLSFNPTITSLTTGMKIRWVSGGANTIVGATVNVDGLGAVTLKKNPGAAALAVGDLGVSGTIIEAEYNGTNFVVLNPPVDLSSYLTSATAASTYAPLASPALTGTPTAPTATAGTNTTQVATTAFVTTAVAGVGSLTLLGTATTTSGNTQTISSLTLTSYKALYVVIKAVSLSAVNIAGWVGFEGSTGSRLTATNSGLAAGDTVSGFAYIDLLAGNYHCVSAMSTITAGTFQPSSTTTNSQAIYYGKHGMTTASTSIVFGPGNGTLTFDAGSIDVYGVK